MKKFYVLVILAALGLTAALPTSAQHRHDALRLENAWARATPPGIKNGAAYVTVVNTGAAADKLIAAASPIARKAELHTHLKEGNVMRMRRVDGIAIAPGATAMLKPGGFHIMLLGLKKTLKKGERFPLTLTFAQAGSIRVDVTVGKPDAAKSEPHSGMQHGH